MTGPWLILIPINWEQLHLRPLSSISYKFVKSLPVLINIPTWSLWGIASLSQENNTVPPVKVRRLYLRYLDIRVVWISSRRRRQDLHYKGIVRISSHSVKRKNKMKFAYSTCFSNRNYYMHISLSDNKKIQNAMVGVTKRLQLRCLFSVNFNPLTPRGDWHVNPP